MNLHDETAVSHTRMDSISDAPLSLAERHQLAACETTIQIGFRAFLAMGRAFATIRDQRLYRATHGDFVSYIGERWPHFDGRRQVDRLIAAAEVQHDLDPIGVQITRESQARPLVGLDAVSRRAAMQYAVANVPNGEPTAQQITQAVAHVRDAPVLNPPQDRRCRHCEQADVELAEARLAVAALQAEVDVLKAQLVRRAAVLPTDAPAWRCMRCGQPAGFPFPPSVADPLRCLRCAREHAVSVNTPMYHREVVA